MAGATKVDRLLRFRKDNKSVPNYIIDNKACCEEQYLDEEPCCRKGYTLKNLTCCKYIV